MRVPQKLLLSFVIVFVFCGFRANARICENLDIRNSYNQLEQKLRDCTIVVGNLKLILLDKDNQNISHSITFPELTEITGYLLFFSVPKVTSIGKLFPNLTVIRGNTLLVDYALIIYYMPDLEEIGLYNLRQIGRGSTRIEQCPHLCHAYTIDWSRIGGLSHRFDYYDDNLGDCQWCPKHCDGLCWNENYCQKVQAEECDPNCVGCNTLNSEQCNACGFSTYLDEGKCVIECPKNKSRNSITYTCVTPQECYNTSGGTWWIFQGECIQECPVAHKKVSEQEGWCVPYADNYKKICEGSHIDSLLGARRFRECTHIQGALEITGQSTSLINELENYLGNVKEIEGYLKISKSSKLNSLNFLKNLKVIRGNQLYRNAYALVVLENQQLHELWSRDNFTLQIEHGTIYFHYNPQLCLSKIEGLVNKTTGLSGNYTDFDVSPYSNGDDKICNYIDLQISVVNITSNDAMVRWEGVTGGKVIAYILHYTEDPSRDVTSFHGRDECSSDNWFSELVTTNSYFIENLSPNTWYTIYIQVLTISPLNSGQTTTRHFKTLSAGPFEPRNVMITSTTNGSIELTWDKPIYSNGDIIYYKLNVFLEKDDPNFFVRNDFCFPLPSTVPDDFEKVENPLELYTSTKECCKEQYWEEWGATRDKRSLQGPNIFELKISENWRSYNITALRHFSVYVIWLSACNDRSACSASLMMYQRTQRKEGADDILSEISVFVNNNSACLNWQEPQDPNAFIISYIVKYWRIDLEYSKPLEECVTRQNYQMGGYGYTLQNLNGGKYSLVVKAVSPAGVGKPSAAVTFEISETPYFPTASSHFSVGYVIAVVVTVYVLVISGLYYYYYSKRKSWSLITNSYSTESFHEEVQYELLLEDLDLDVPNETKQNAVGIICNGFIKTQNRPCTVKFGQKYTDAREFKSFIKEATKMKISHSHHVVNLLGIISKRQSPLVVMELMAWGDLKTFLKSLKGSEDTILHVDMYRMAAEIADGMMYLASKKIVHSDLAARNCLVSAGRTVKIVNFGITKDVYKTDYYRKENGHSIPVRWMAPESLADGVVTTNSNVWSYGVILWEIVTLAEQPYPNLLDEEVLRYVIGKNIMEPPLGCADLLYEMMVACWRWRSKERPTFMDLLKKLQTNVMRDFKLLSFYHSREGRTYRKTAKKQKEQDQQAIKVSPAEKHAAHWNKEGDKVQLQVGLENENLPSTSR